jgi:glycosyltransferase involved in cell wall biosynthesis
VRILQVIHWFLPYHTSGSEVYVAQLSAALGRRHVVAVYCREDGRPDSLFHEEEGSFQGYPVHRVYHNPPAGPGYLAGKALTRFRNRLVEESFRRYVERFRPDVVHFHHLFKLSGALISIAQQMDVPTVVTLHDYWFLCDNGQLLRSGLVNCQGPRGGLRCADCAELPRVWRRLLAPVLIPFFIYRTRFLRRALQRADAIIAPSRYLQGVFIRHGFPAGRILLCDNGTDASWRRKARHAAGERVRFGYIGTLAPHKGIHLLLEAFAGLQREAELRIYGDPTANPDYVVQLQALVCSPLVSFKGAFAREELPRVLGELDVLVVPSLWAENSPVTIHEARVARLPVLAADIGGMPDLIREGEAGWLFRAGDAGDLRRQIAAVLEAPQQLARVRSRIRPVKSIEENAHELEALYARLITHRREAK